MAKDPYEVFDEADMSARQGNKPRDPYEDAGFEVDPLSAGGEGAPLSENLKELGYQAVGPGFNRGLSATLKAPGALLAAVGQGASAAANYLLGTQLPADPLGAVRMDNAATRWLESGPKPTTTGGKVGEAIGEVAGSSVAPYMGMQARAGRVALEAARSPAPRSTLQAIDRAISKPMASAPYATGAVEAGSTVGAGLGLSVARENEWGPAGEQLAMIAGGFSPALLQYTPTGMITRAGKGVANRLIPEDFTAPLAERIAPPDSGSFRQWVGDKVRSIGAGQEDLARNVATREIQRDLTKAHPLKVAEMSDIARDIPEARFTIAEQTEVPALMERQAGLSSEMDTATVLRELQRREENRIAINAAKDRYGPVGEYDPEFIVTEAGKALAARRGALETDVARVTGDQEAAAELLSTPRGGRVERGIELRDALLDAKRKARQRMDAVVKELGLDDPSQGIAVNDLKQRLVEAYRSRSQLRMEDDAAGLTEHEIVDRVRKMKNEQSVGAMFELRSQVQGDLEALRRNPQSGNATARRGLQRMLTELDNYIDTLGTRFLTPADRHEMAVYMDMYDFAKRPIDPPQSLTQWLIQSKGVMDQGGELTNMIGAPNMRPGLVNNAGGMNLDDAALKAWESGFIRSPDRPDIQTFLDHLYDDLVSGNRVVRIADEPVMEELAMQAQYRADLEESGMRWSAGRSAFESDVMDHIFATRAQAASAEASDLGERYALFRDAYRREYKDRFEKGAVWRVTSKDGRRQYKIRDEQVAEEFFKAGDISAARQLKEILGEHHPAVRAAALDDLERVAIKDGVINQGAYQRWMARYKDVLQEYPRIKEEVENLGDMIDGVAQRQSQLKLRRDEIESSILAHEMARIERGSLRADQYIEQAIENPRKMRSLTTALQTEEARTALQKAVWERIYQDKSPLSYLDNNAVALEAVLGPEKMARARSIIRAFEKTQMIAPPIGKAPSASPAIDSIEEKMNMSLSTAATRAYHMHGGFISKRYVATNFAMTMLRGYSARQANRVMLEAMLDTNIANKLTTLAKGNVSDAEVSRIYSFLYAAGLGADREEPGAIGEMQTPPRRTAEDIRQENRVVAEIVGLEKEAGTKRGVRERLAKANEGTRGGVFQTGMVTPRKFATMLGLSLSDLNLKGDATPSEFFDALSNLSPADLVYTMKGAMTPAEWGGFMQAMPEMLTTKEGNAALFDTIGAIHARQAAIAAMAKRRKLSNRGLTDGFLAEQAAAREANPLPFNLPVPGGGVNG